MPVDPIQPIRIGSSSRAFPSPLVSPDGSASVHTPLRLPARAADSDTGSNTNTTLALPASTPTNVSASAPPAYTTAKEITERSRILDDEFRLLPRSDDSDEEESDCEQPASASGGPFLTHSYQGENIHSGLASTQTEGGEHASTTTTKGDDSFVNGRWGKAVLLPCAILLSVANSITWKRMLNRYASVDGSHRNLEFFVNQWTLFLYTIVCGAVCMYRWFFTDLISAEQRAVSQKRFAIMGALDAIAGLFGAVGGSITAGQVQIVINQANIPITMLFSRIYLNVVSYAWSQYLGAAVIIAGGLVSAFGTSGDESQRVLWYGSLLIFIAVIPGSMSNVYKEENFKEHNLDLFYLSTYVSIWQGIMSFACIPLFSLSYFGGIPLWEMPQNLIDGFQCFMGDHLEGYNCENPSPSSASLVIMFVFANFVYNLVLLMMVKHGSALFLVIACAMALPLTNIVFTQTWVMGEDVEDFSIYNMIGLVLVVVGFLLYSIVNDPERQEHGEFMVPQIQAGHSLYLTEYFPSVSELDYYYHHNDSSGERRHSFDFHSSPSIRRLQDARKKRIDRAIRKIKTPSRTP